MFKDNLYMNKKFEDIDNEVLALFLENKVSLKEQEDVTNTLRTYKDLWVLANMYLNCKDNRGDI